MKVKDLIKQLKDLNPESELEFVGFAEYGYGEYMEVITEDCHIQEVDDFVQLIISGEV